MRHRISGRHFGRDTAHRVSMYRNLVTDLLRYERITTTEAKAKEIRPMAEKIITLGKRGDLHARRQALAFVYDPKVVKKVFDEIGPRMRERPGGYTRITAIEDRKGDGSRMAAIELVDLVNAPATPRPQRVTAAPTAGPRSFQPLPATTLAAVPAIGGAEAVLEEATEPVADEVVETVAEAAESVPETPETESKEQS